MAGRDGARAALSLGESRRGGREAMGCGEGERVVASYFGQEREASARGGRERLPARQSSLSRNDRDPGLPIPHKEGFTTPRSRISARVHVHAPRWEVLGAATPPLPPRPPGRLPCSWPTFRVSSLSASLRSNREADPPRFNAPLLPERMPSWARRADPSQERDHRARSGNGSRSSGSSLVRISR